MLIPFHRSYWTDANDDARLSTASPCALFLEGTTAGTVPSLALAAIALTNKGIWAIASVRTSVGDSFVQLARIGERSSAAHFHSLALQYDNDGALHYHVDGERRLTVERFGVPSAMMRTVQRIGRNANEFQV